MFVKQSLGFLFFPQILCKISIYKSKKLSIHQIGQNQRKGQEPHKAKPLNRKGEGEVLEAAGMRLYTLEAGVHGRDHQKHCSWNTAGMTRVMGWKEKTINRIL